MDCPDYSGFNVEDGTEDCKYKKQVQEKIIKKVVSKHQLYLELKQKLLIII